MGKQDAQLAAEPALTFSDPAVQRCPFPVYDRLRQEAPVFKDPVTGHYVLTRYDDVRKVLLDHRRFSSNANMLGRRQTPVTEQINRIYDEKGWRLADSIQLLDEPEHRVKRSLVDRAFSHWNVEELSSYIEATVDNLIDDFIDKRQCEFVSAFAVHLTMRVIANLLGVKDEDPRQFERDAERLRFWSDCAIETISPTISPERELKLVDYNLEFQHFCVANIRRVEANPGKTLLDELISVVRDENGVADIAELLILMRTVLVAGNETTRFTLAAGMKTLIDQPELVGELRGDEERIAAFVEEVLRLRSPVQTLFRRVKEDVVIGDVAIPAGSRVEVRYGAANRDPQTFEDPWAINLCRKGKSHLAFGMGIHNCIGASLARKELKIAFRRILDRMDNFKPLHGEDSFGYSAMYISYGMTKLEMTFDRRA